MNKPKRSDFPKNRRGDSRYNQALKTYEKYVKKTNKEKVRKQQGYTPKPVWKKGMSREEYRKILLPWREKKALLDKKLRKEKLASEGKKDTGRGVRNIASLSLIHI